ncbi:uncharacterized protein A4U43_UnF270 [Asparagus officinalis]|uniref:Uncharacterized protein n=1 Tax=Asparagus officinalis TaxID=4686 RepID=A0A1R3L7U3_ASPOF|nr:uncharacterized protein A4U43_UnF270 [Asparagus officinalis]
MDFKLEFVLNSHHPPNIQMSPTLRIREGSNDESGGREGSNGERGGSPGLALDILELILRPPYTVVFIGMLSPDVKEVWVKASS